MSFFSSLILVALGSGIDNLVFGSNVILLFSLYTHHHTIIYITYFYMDAIQQTILIPSQPSFSTSSPHQLVHFTNSHKSSDVEKQALIAKIRHVHGKNAELEAKQQSLQNTVRIMFIRSSMISGSSYNRQHLKISSISNKSRRKMKNWAKRPPDWLQDFARPTDKANT